jgi:hypothetical protein
MDATLRTTDERCDPIIHEHGHVLMTLAVSRQCAREIVESLRADEERSAVMYETPEPGRQLFDWHFVGGRAVFKSLTRSEHARRRPETA